MKPALSTCYLTARDDAGAPRSGAAPDLDCRKNGTMTGRRPIAKPAVDRRAQSRARRQDLSARCRPIGGLRRPWSAHPSRARIRRARRRRSGRKQHDAAVGSQPPSRNRMAIEIVKMRRKAVTTSRRRQSTPLTSAASTATARLVRPISQNQLAASAPHSIRRSRHSSLSRRGSSALCWGRPAGGERPPPCAVSGRLASPAQQREHHDHPPNTAG